MNKYLIILLETSCLQVDLKHTLQSIYSFTNFVELDLLDNLI